MQNEKRRSIRRLLHFPFWRKESIQVKHAGTGDEFPRRLCDPLPPVTAVLYYRWLAAGLYDKIITQVVGGLRVHVGIRHPAGTGSFCRIRIYLLVYTTADCFLVVVIFLKA